jgi:hypothetical protein
MTTATFDRAPHRDAIAQAIDSAGNSPRDREAMTWARAEDETWWGPRTDPGGDPMRLDHDAAGPFVTIAGRRVPALHYDGAVRVGIPDRLGYCFAWATEAAGRLLRDRRTGIAIVLGRAFGDAQQTWTEYRDPQGRPSVLDLTVSERPFDRAEYMRAIHAVVGTRLPVPDWATFDRLRELTAAGTFAGSRADFLTALAPRKRQRG